MTTIQTATGSVGESVLPSVVASGESTAQFAP